MEYFCQHIVELYIIKVSRYNKTIRRDKRSEQFGGKKKVPYAWKKYSTNNKTPIYLGSCKTP